MSAPNNPDFLDIDKIIRRKVADQNTTTEAHKEYLRQECIRAQEHIRRTGLHLTQEEVEAWLMELEAGKDVEPPECHS